MENFVSHQSIANNPLWKDRSLRLRSLDIELTERCDNACQHCYINLPREDAAAQRAELSAEEWKRILSEAAALGALNVRFTGGEPLLRDDFAEIYQHARRLGLRVTLFTNARRITPELVTLFRRMPLLHKIEISVYGMRAETYEAVSRTPGSFAEFRRGMDLLLAGGIPLVVKSVDLPQTRPELQAFQDWAATLPGMDLPASVTRVLDLRARRDCTARMRHIAALRMDPDELAGNMLRLRDMRAETLRLARSHGGRGTQLLSCGAGNCALPCVDAYGHMQACMLLRAPQLSYDLRAGSLKDAVEHHFPRLKHLKPENPAYLQRCERCFLRGMCDQCAAKSWMETGTLDTPVEYLCQITHAVARRMGLLELGEHSWEAADGASRTERMIEEKA